MESGVITGLRRDDLDLAATLSSGQVFRWTCDADGAWAGMVGQRRLRLATSASGETLFWEADGPDGQGAVRAFLRLDEVDLPKLAEGWCARDGAFAQAWAQQPGLRILRQDPDECFFSFLCASVAPIKRISGMLRAVASEAARLSEPPLPSDTLYLPFPTAAALAQIAEARLRTLGLGFRARRVVEAARALQTLPADHLRALRAGATLDEAKRELQAFFGVGEKIADCICLFSLDKDAAVPVDTHIWRIARARYLPELADKALTPAAYARVTQAFHDRFGPWAGWAQQTLFYRAAVARDRG